MLRYHSLEDRQADRQGEPELGWEVFDRTGHGVFGITDMDMGMGACLSAGLLAGWLVGQAPSRSGSFDACVINLHRHRHRHRHHVL